MPELDALRAELAQHGVGIVALSVAPESDAVAAAAKHLGLTMPVAWTEQEMLGPNDLRGVPSVLYVDASGRVIGAESGAQSAKKVRARALELVR